MDFSIMPSYHCNLRCWFCMYNGGPDAKAELDYEKTKLFLLQFDWSLVNSFGFYGGEPSIDTPLYDKFIELVPHSIPKFVITNGTWSVDTDRASRFLKWCIHHSFRVVVSSTPEHIKHQWRSFLENLTREFDGVLLLKTPDRIHAQGRARGESGVPSDCELACLRKDRNTRLGLKPDGNIVFQNCHGEYHTVQTYEEPFDGMLGRTKRLVEHCVAGKVAE